MTYLPVRTGIPIVDRNLRDIADAMATLSSGTTTNVSTGSSTSVVVPAGSAIINYGVESGVGAAGVTITFTTAFSNTSYVPAYTARVGAEDVMCDVQILSASQMKFVPLGRTGVTIRWSAIGS